MVYLEQKPTANKKLSKKINMRTKVLSAEKGFKRAVSLIKKGDIVVFPTETVYGIGADAFNEKAVKKIFEAKGRPQDNPLIVHVSSPDKVKGIASSVPEEFYLLAAKFMPGPLTVVLPKSLSLPDVVTAGGKTVAIRIPASDYARKLIEASCPLAAPSANRSKHVSPTSARHVYDDLQGRVKLILDGGECDVGIESTVLDLTTDIPTILRPGAITAEMIADALGQVSSNGNVIGVAKSPGMKYTHYAPKVPAVVAYDLDKAIAEYNHVRSKGEKPVLIMLEDAHANVGGRNFISLGSTLEEYMHNLYASLREAEKQYTYIIMQGFESKEGVAVSLMNRVLKAAGGKTL